VSKAKDFINANGGMLSVIAVAVGLLAAYGEWRISANIAAELEAQDTLSASDMKVYEARQEAIKEDVEELKDNDDRINGKLDRIVDILLEDE
jgi:cell division protein FtsB